MRIWLARIASQGCRLTKTLAATFALVMMGASTALAQAGSEVGGEANLKLPDLSSVRFLNEAIDGHALLLIGIVFCVLGLGFGLAIYMRLKNLPVFSVQHHPEASPGPQDSHYLFRRFANLIRERKGEPAIAER
jgi:hypothetical protein